MPDIRHSEPVVVLTAANPWDIERMADRQLAQALSAYAHVLYVDPPESVVGRLRGRSASQPRLSVVAKGISRLRPTATPGVTRRPAARVNAVLAARQVRWALAALRGTSAAHLDANAITPTLGRIPARRRAFWAQDDYVGMAPLVGVDPRLMEGAEHLLHRQADVVIAANPRVARRFENRGGRRVELIPFGCDVTRFAAAATGPRAPDDTMLGPRALVMGTINDRLDLDILTAVAGRGVPLLIVGPRAPGFYDRRFDGLLRLPQVEWLGERPFTAMPAYAAHSRVGLVPYTHSRFNEGSFPLKTLEYVAAGCAVVATDLPAVRWLGSDAVRIADDPTTFSEAVVDALHTSPVPAAQEAVHSHSWASRAAEFAHVLGLSDSPR